MSPSSPQSPALESELSGAMRVAATLGSELRDQRIKRSWSLREVARRARVSVTAVHDAEAGRVCSLATYVRISVALNLRLEFALTDPRRGGRSNTGADYVHAAMGELEAAHFGSFGLPVGIDEPYQHYRFSGRADVISWRLEPTALLHIENRTQFPDIQGMAGAWNAKRSYLPGALAERLGVRHWQSVCHAMVVLWSAEALDTLRSSPASFRTLASDGDEAFQVWWRGEPPAAGTSSTLLVLDPAARSRQPAFVSLATALAARAPHRNYADAAAALRRRRQG